MRPTNSPGAVDKLLVYLPGICACAWLLVATSCPPCGLGFLSTKTRNPSTKAQALSWRAPLHNTLLMGPCRARTLTHAGTDGTGQAILPQLPLLHASGYDVYCLTMPPEDRSTWADSTQQVRCCGRAGVWVGLTRREAGGHWGRGFKQEGAW